MPKNTPQKIQEKLLAWYDRHQRVLPWRAPRGQGPTDPYLVWLSEIMLQQTTVAAVKAYFIKFKTKWPNFKSLAAASLDDVLTAWAGLGYYSRARNLYACAKKVAQEFDGKLPADENALLGLPGIGPYTAAAITAIAFDKPATVVDGNVERVVARLFALEAPLPNVKPELRKYTAALTPQKRPGDFAQAMMDLGATVCTPRNPNCNQCPLSEMCNARAAGTAAELPRRLAKAARPTRRGVAFWLENGQGCVLLRRREEKGLLGGMMEIPSSEWLEQESPQLADVMDTAPIPKLKWEETGKGIIHVFTHFTLELTIARATLSKQSRTKIVPLPKGCVWAKLDELDKYALPSVMLKIVRAQNKPEKDNAAA